MGQTETTRAKFVLNFPTQDVPADVMRLAKRCLMNYSSVALLATSRPRHKAATQSDYFAQDAKTAQS